MSRRASRTSHMLHGKSNVSREALEKPTPRRLGTHAIVLKKINNRMLLLITVRFIVNFF